MKEIKQIDKLIQSIKACLHESPFHNCDGCHYNAKINCVYHLLNDTLPFLENIEKETRHTMKFRLFKNKKIKAAKAPLPIDERFEEPFEDVEYLATKINSDPLVNKHYVKKKDVINLILNYSYPEEGNECKVDKIIAAIDKLSVKEIEEGL